MFDTPEAAPTSSAGTALVATDEHGPFDRPRPTATATIGSTKARYDHEAPTKHSAAKPAVLSAKPPPTTARTPNLCASPTTRGAVATRATVSGSVARPASSGDMPSVAGSWK